MKKKIELFCLFLITIVMIPPAVSSSSLVSEQQGVMTSTDEYFVYQEKPISSVLTGYLLIHVSVYAPGEGLHPYVGANISVKGLFYKYTGQTDERGDCLFQLHTKLFRPKLYFIKVSIPPENWLHTKINSVYLQSGQVVYKDFLFVVL